RIGKWEPSPAPLERTPIQQTVHASSGRRVDGGDVYVGGILNTADSGQQRRTAGSRIGIIERGIPDSVGADASRAVYAARRQQQYRGQNQRGEKNAQARTERDYRPFFFNREGL